MLRTGNEHLDSIRDGRVVYIGSERVEDVTRHPAFRNAAQTVAALYDMKADPALARRDDIRGRWRPPRDLFPARALARGSAAAHDRPPAHRRFHLRHVRPLARSRRVLRHRHGDEARRVESRPTAIPTTSSPIIAISATTTSTSVYAVVPPQAARNPEFYHRQNIPVPTLRVVREDDCGVVISGMKMLATGAVFANEIWIGNVIPLAPDQNKEAITCAIPCNAPGLQLWSRQPLEIELHVGIRFAARLSLRRDRQHAALRRGQGAVGARIRS